MTPSAPAGGLNVGRYTLHEVIASGGMASVHFGRMVGSAGFARTVAIKRLHPHLARDPEFTTMFLDEARLAARVQHPNVVPTIDVVSLDGELLLVMEYVRGESLSRLLIKGHEAKVVPPLRALVSIFAQALYGLHAAHEAKGEDGKQLEIVHRDVSPQNILVGADGVARVVDFGVAKAASRAHSTRDGKIKGKLAYMSPEQIRREKVDRRADVYAVGVVMWEALAGRRLFVADDAVAVLDAVLMSPVPDLKKIKPDVPDALAAIVHKALSRENKDRFTTALEMAAEIESVTAPAPQHEVARWVQATAAADLEARDRHLKEVEAATPSDPTSAPELSKDVVRLSEMPTAVGSDKPVTEAASQVTGISVSNDVTPKRKRRSYVRWMAGAFAAATLGLAVTFGFGRIRKSADSKNAEATASAPPPSLSAEATAPVLATSTTASAQASPSIAPVGSPAPLHAVDHKLPAKKSRPSAASRAECDPPFTVDSAGIEHFKPGCL